MPSEKPRTKDEKRGKERRNKIFGSISLYQRNVEGNYIPSNFFLYSDNKIKSFVSSEKLVRHLLLESAGSDELPIFITYNLARVYIPLRKEFIKLSEIFNIEVLAKNSMDLLSITIKKGNKNILKLMGLSSLFNCQVSEIPRRLNLDISLNKSEAENAILEAILIHKYVNKIISENKTISENDLGKKLYTQTSLARIEDSFYFDKEIDGINPYLGYMFWCKQEQKPRNTEISPELLFDFAYTQQAVNRGGIAFNAINNSFILHDDCISIDSNSMHHSCINCHYYPERFKPINDYEQAQKAVNYILDTPLEEVIERFYKPFNFAFSAQFSFKNIRLKEGSIFEREGIAILSESRFSTFIDNYNIETTNEKLYSMKEYGYSDIAELPCFANSKLISAISCSLWLTEIELWNISQVYDFDTCEIVQGFYSCNFMRSPDFAQLASMRGYKLKKQVKKIVKEYREEPYKTIEELPEHIIKRLENGSISKYELEDFYKYDIKAKFNSLYGRMATDENKPKYTFDEETGDFITEDSPEPSEFKPIQRPKVNLSFGARIVGYSRLHMIVAILLLAQDENISFICGDTDSLILSGITKAEVLALLDPLHKKLNYSFDLCTARVKKYFPEHFYKMDKLGFFEIEKENIRVFASWPKTRAEIDRNDNLKIVCSGLAQNDTDHNLTSFITWLATSENEYCNGWASACLFALGFNKSYSNNLVVNYQNTIIPDCDSGMGFGTELANFTIGDLSNKQNRNTFKYLNMDNRVDLIEEFISTQIDYDIKNECYTIDQLITG